MYLAGIQCFTCTPHVKFVIDMDKIFYIPIILGKGFKL